MDKSFTDIQKWKERYFDRKYTHKGLVKKQADGRMEILQNTLQFTFDGPLIHVSKTKEQWCNYLIIWVRDKGWEIFITQALRKDKAKMFKCFIN